MPSTAATIGFVLWASEYRNLTALEARGVPVFDVPSFRKSSRSLPAVKTPGSPEMIRQRIAALSCAPSIAALMSRYMSCVIAFFFSGRLSRINRTASSSVTVTCPVMVLAFKQSAMMGNVGISYSLQGAIHNWPQPHHGIALVWSYQGEGWGETLRKGIPQAICRPLPGW